MEPHARIAVGVTLGVTLPLLLLLLVLVFARKARRRRDLHVPGEGADGVERLDERTREKIAAEADDVEKLAESALENAGIKKETLLESSLGASGLNGREGRVSTRGREVEDALIPVERTAWVPPPADSEPVTSTPLGKKRGRPTKRPLEQPLPAERRVTQSPLGTLHNRPAEGQRNALDNIPTVPAASEKSITFTEEGISAACGSDTTPLTKSRTVTIDGSSFTMLKPNHLEFVPQTQESSKAESLGWKDRRSNEVEEGERVEDEDRARNDEALQSPSRTNKEDGGVDYSASRGRACLYSPVPQDHRLSQKEIQRLSRSRNMPIGRKQKGTPEAVNAFRKAATAASAFEAAFQPRGGSVAPKLLGTMSNSIGISELNEGDEEKPFKDATKGYGNDIPHLSPSKPIDPSGYQGLVQQRAEDATRTISPPQPLQIMADGYTSDSSMSEPQPVATASLRCAEPQLERSIRLPIVMLGERHEPEAPHQILRPSEPPRAYTDYVKRERERERMAHEGSYSLPRSPSSSQQSRCSPLLSAYGIESGSRDSRQHHLTNSRQHHLRTLRDTSKEDGTEGDDRDTATMFNASRHGPFYYDDDIYNGEPAGIVSDCVTSGGPTYICPWAVEIGPNPVIFPHLKDVHKMDSAVESQKEGSFMHLPDMYPEAEVKDSDVVRISTLSREEPVQPRASGLCIMRDLPSEEHENSRGGASHEQISSSESATPMRSPKSTDESTPISSVDSPEDRPQQKIFDVLGADINRTMSPQPEGLSCAKCNATFHSSDSIIEHIQRRRCRRHTCHSCPARFALTADLNRHLRTVHKETQKHAKAFVCSNPRCNAPNKQFLRKDNFERHVRRCLGATVSGEL